MKRKSYKKLIAILFSALLLTSCNEVVAGPQGDQGIQGIQGEQGPQGDQGDKGPQGPQGPQGEQGEKGMSGPIGPQGPVGPQGEIGPQGETGPQGEKGEKGDTGSQGEKGEKGDAGDNPTITINEDGNFVVDEEETEISSQGTQGPQGPQGPQGDKGETGDEGDAGTYYSVTFIACVGGYVDTNHSDYIVGEEVKLDLHPDIGYIISGLVINGLLIYVPSGDSYFAKMVEGGLVVRGVFEVED